MKPAHLLGVGLLMLITFNSHAQTQLAVGTVAIYSDGDIEKLIAYDNDHPVWEDTRKRRYTLADSPLIPRLEYRNLLKPDSDYQVRVTSGNPRDLAIAPVGQKAHFQLRRQYRDGTSRMRDWTCEVLSPSQTRLEGTTHPVNRYKCQRFTPHKKLLYPVLRETRLISYSPELGLTLQLERETRSGTRMRKLKYLLAPAEASAKKIARAHRRVIERNN